MSGRRRRSESLWDRKEEEEMSGKVPYSGFRGDASPKHSNFDPNDGNDSIPMDPAFDEWENQYSSRPSDNSYDLPYRSGDRGTGNMSKDRDRNRGRDRERGSMRSRSRSRSRSRGRGSDERREIYDSGGDSRVSSRPCKDFAAGNCRRGLQCRFLHQEPVDLMTEKYSGGSRFRDDKSFVGKGSDGYRKDTGRKSGGDRDRDRDHTTSSGDDYHRGSNRNAYDDQDQRRQSTRAPCRFFMMGKCNRTNCKFSHDVPKSAGYEGRPHDNSRPWNERQPQDQSGFSDFDDKSKGWTGPTWNDLESGGFADNILDDKNRRTWDTNGSEKNSDILDNQESQIIQSHSQHAIMPDTTSGGQNMVSGQTNQQLHSYGSSDFLPSMDFQYPSTLNGTEKSSEMPSSNGSAQGMFLHLDLQKQTDIQPLETSKNDMDASKEQASQVSASLPQISPNLNLANALELLYSLPNTASSGAPVESMVVEQNLDTKSKEQYEKASRDGVPMEQGNQVSSIDPNPPTKLDGKQESVGNLEVKEGDNNENMNAGKSEAQGKVEEGNISNDEKAMRQFKVVLVEFVKEILKPTWKEGKMSREVYKTIVKKVVDKVTSTIQGNQIPKTQEKIDQYLAFSKSKITKLVEAYVGRFLKA